MKILLTGGTKGIGLALLSLLKEKNEILVVARDTRTAKETFKNNKNIEFLSVDLSLLGSHKKVISAVKRKWKKIDIIINNAGMLIPKSPTDTSPLEIESVMNLNFVTPSLLTKELLPFLSSNGLVVNIISPAIYRNREKMWTYVASKRALKSFSEALAEKYPVLQYYPGIINTSILNGRKSFIAKLIQKEPEYTALKLVHHINNRRTGVYFEPIARIFQFAGILGF